MTNKEQRYDASCSTKKGGYVAKVVKTFGCIAQMNETHDEFQYKMLHTLRGVCAYQKTNHSAKVLLKHTRDLTTGSCPQGTPDVCWGAAEVRRYTTTRIGEVIKDRRLQGPMSMR
jgi:hypothetical protein